MNIRPDTRIARDPAHVAAATGEREVAVMSMAQGAYYGLNEVATRIWEIAAAPHSVADICATLELEYEIEHDRCQREVVECVELLVREGLVRIVDADAG